MTQERVILDGEESSGDLTKTVSTTGDELASMETWGLQGRREVERQGKRWEERVGGGVAGRRRRPAAAAVAAAAGAG